MSFRRNREQSLEWHKGVEEHRERLVAIGIPREVWADRAVWLRFLQEGFHSDSSDWRMLRFSFDDLDTENLRLLHQFLCDLGFEPDCHGFEVWDSLQRQFAFPNETVSISTDNA